MTNQMVIAITIKLICGFIPAIASVLLWSKTRDAVWLTMVAGVIFLYLETLLEILDAFGFVSYHLIKVGDVELLPLLFNTLPFLFLGAGMIIFLIRVHRY